MFEKRARSAYPLNETIARRWSGRAYDPDRAVADDLLGSLLEAARWAPSCYGDQPWSYLVWNRFRDRAAWQRGFDCLAAGNQAWARHAPLLLLACARSLFRRDGKPSRWGAYDTGAASENLVLQATALGLMAHQMGGFDAQSAREHFGIPTEYEPMAMIAVGYQRVEAAIPAEQREREYQARSRLPLSEIAFQGTWGRALTL